MTLGEMIIFGMLLSMDGRLRDTKSLWRTLLDIIQMIAGIWLMVYAGIGLVIGYIDATG